MKKYPTPEHILNEIVSFEFGIDNLPYAVFKDNSLSWEYSELIHREHYGIAHFGNYENAVLLQDTIGM